MWQKPDRRDKPGAGEGDAADPSTRPASRCSVRAGGLPAASPTSIAPERFILIESRRSDLIKDLKK